MNYVETGPNYEIEFDDDDNVMSVTYDLPEKIPVACEHCETVFKVSKKHVGKTTNCKRCQHLLLIIWIEPPNFASVEPSKDSVPVPDDAPASDRVNYFSNLGKETLQRLKFYRDQRDILVVKVQLLEEAGCPEDAITKLADPISAELKRLTEETEAELEAVNLLLEEVENAPVNEYRRSGSGWRSFFEGLLVSFLGGKPAMRPRNECGNCGYSWYPRGRNHAAGCPQCKSAMVRVVYAEFSKGRN